MATDRALIPPLQLGLRILAALGLGGIAAAVTATDSYPNRPIRFVTAAVGGGNDFAARLIAQGLAASFGQQVIVDNRGGSHIPQLIVSKATPDGYTLLVQNNTVWVAPLLEKVGYDHWKELVPISLTARTPNILVVHPSLPVSSVQELIAAAKAAPGELNYASGVVGSSNYIAAEVFKAMAGVNLTRIESRPTRVRVWEYVFFCDFEGHVDDAKVAAAIAELRPRCDFVKVLGSYPQAETAR